MGHTYTSLLYHCVFSTKERRPLLAPGLQRRLWPYLGGIARENHMKTHGIGGTDDHVHLLLGIPANLTVAQAMKLIKGVSSKWVSATFPGQEKFQWQEGYGAFSVSISHKDDTLAYIARQEEHHRKWTFQEEFIEFLVKHGIEYDERFVWG